MEEAKKPIALRGEVEEIVYKNDESGYVVCHVEVGGEPVVMVGVMPCIFAGEEIEAEGEWTTHPAFGRQFSVERVTRRLPATTGAVMRFLSGGLSRGVGEVTSRRIVDMFGEETLEIIEHRPHLLTRVKGMSEKKAQELRAAYLKWGVMRRLCDFFDGYELPQRQIITVYATLGDGCLDYISQNPYILCDEPMLIPFETADKIAADLLGEEAPSRRLGAAVKHVLRHNLKNGHTFLPRDTLKEVVCSMLDEGPDAVETEMDELLGLGEIMLFEGGGYEAIYLPHMLGCELSIAARLAVAGKRPIVDVDIEKELSALESEFSIEYAPEQKRAVEIALSRGVLVLTGGPGTGKTTILKAVIRLLRDRGQRMLLAAPTGRAAKRMNELCGEEAKTIHRLLETGYRRGEAAPHFGRNEKNPLKADWIIVDECSMVDCLLFDALLRALPWGCRLVLSGDADQLPSIGPGNVLRDIIKSGLVSTVALKTIFRQAGESLIVVNAHRINEGEYPDLSARDGDFFFLPVKKGTDIAPLVISLCRDRLPKAYGVSPSVGIQVISPTRKGEGGTAFLNRALQDTLNPPSRKKAQLVFRETLFRVGDKVMQIKNDYDIEWTCDDGSLGTGAFNGDVGEIIRIDPGPQIIEVRYDDRTVTYTTDNLDELEIAYAITVHKSQGSEFPIVILVLPDSAPSLMTRNLLYTAVTRARDMLIVVGGEGAVYKMVDNNRQLRRFSSLSELMKEAWEGTKEEKI